MVSMLLWPGRLTSRAARHPNASPARPRWQVRVERLARPWLDPIPAHNLPLSSASSGGVLMPTPLSTDSLIQLEPRRPVHRNGQRSIPFRPDHLISNATDRPLPNSRLAHPDTMATGPSQAGSTSRTAWRARHRAVRRDPRGKCRGGEPCARRQRPRPASDRGWGPAQRAGSPGR